MGRTFPVVVMECPNLWPTQGDCWSCVKLSKRICPLGKIMPWTWIFRWIHSSGGDAGTTSCHFCRLSSEPSSQFHVQQPVWNDYFRPQAAPSPGTARICLVNMRLIFSTATQMWCVEFVGICFMWRMKIGTLTPMLTCTKVIWFMLPVVPCRSL